MDGSRVWRSVVSWTLASAMLFALAVPVFAQDGDDAGEEAAPVAEAPLVSPDGVYAVVGKTNTGKQVPTNVLVTSLQGGDRIQFSARVEGIPVTTSGPASWNAERTQVTVPISIYIFGLVDASGSITLIAAQTGWEFTGSGSGSVLTASGSATAAGFMPGGVASTPTLVSEATGVSETMQSADDALSVLQPAEPTGDMDSEAALQGAAAVLFALFVMIFLQMILGLEIW